MSWVRIFIYDSWVREFCCENKRIANEFFRENIDRLVGVPNDAKENSPSLSLQILFGNLQTFYSTSEFEFESMNTSGIVWITVGKDLRVPASDNYRTSSPDQSQEIRVCAIYLCILSSDKGKDEPAVPYTSMVRVAERPRPQIDYIKETVYWIIIKTSSILHV